MEFKYSFVMFASRIIDYKVSNIILTMKQRERERGEREIENASACLIQTHSQSLTRERITESDSVTEWCYSA